MTSAAALGTAPHVTDFSLLHHIIRGHLADQNAFAVHCALSLPVVHLNPLFWATCDYKCGLASAVLSAHIEAPAAHPIDSSPAEVQGTQPGGGAAALGGILSQLQFSQSFADDEGAFTQNATGDAAPRLHRLSLNEVYLLLKTCAAEEQEEVAASVEGDDEAAVGGARQRPIQRFVDVIEGTVVSPGGAALDLAEVANVLHESFLRRHRRYRCGDKRKRPLVDAGQGPEHPSVREAAAAALNNDHEIAVIVDDAINGDAVDGAIQALKSRQESRPGDALPEPRHALELLHAVALPGTVRVADSFDDVCNGEFAASTANSRRTAATPAVGEERMPRRRAFSAEEDAAIIDGMRRFTGADRFTMIHHSYKSVWQPGRTPTQLHDHWRQVLRGKTLSSTAI